MSCSNTFPLNIILFLFTVLLTLNSTFLYCQTVFEQSSNTKQSNNKSVKLSQAKSLIYSLPTGLENDKEKSLPEVGIDQEEVVDLKEDKKNTDKDSIDNENLDEEEQYEEAEDIGDPLFRKLIRKLLTQHPDWMLEDLKNGQYALIQPYGQSALIDGIAWIEEQFPNATCDNQDCTNFEFTDENVKQLIETYFGKDPRLELSDIQTQIMPIIRSEDFFTQVRAIRRKKRMKVDVPFVFKILTAELRVLYVMDQGNRKTILTEDHLQQLELPKTQLHNLAIDNLIENIPSYDFSGTENLMRLHAGGMYESSFMLISNFWRPEILGFDEPPVVFVPHPNVLLITREGDVEGMKLAREVLGDPTHRRLKLMTVGGFVYRDGRWVRVRSGVIRVRGF